jgi:hypothetical protein
MNIREARSDNQSKLTQLRIDVQRASAERTRILLSLGRLNSDASIEDVSDDGITIHVWLHGGGAMEIKQAGFSYSGGGEIDISWEDATHYFQDPIGYIARRFFGATAAEYIEWVEGEGMPLCGGTTVRGKLCKQPVGRIQMTFSEWKALHRVGTCKKHSVP